MDSSKALDWKPPKFPFVTHLHFPIVISPKIPTIYCASSNLKGHIRRGWHFLQFFNRQSFILISTIFNHLLSCVDNEVIEILHLKELIKWVHMAYPAPTWSENWKLLLTMAVWSWNYLHSNVRLKQSKRLNAGWNILAAIRDSDNDWSVNLWQPQLWALNEEQLAKSEYIFKVKKRQESRYFGCLALHIKERTWISLKWQSHIIQWLVMENPTQVSKDISLMSLQGACISHKTLQDMKLEAQVFEDIHTSR